MPKKATTKKAKKSSAKKTRKTTARKSTKKTAKKESKKTTAKNVKLLVCAPDDKCFWTNDGQILKNLEELKLAFGTMDDEVFMHHVNKEKNDFADWVEYVLEDQDCAIALRKSRKPGSAQTTVIRHLRFYN